MKKLLYIVPHLSTGGMPQYVLKQIQTFKDKFDISLIEVNYYGKDFTVQRDQIEKLVDFYPIYSRMGMLVPKIAEIDPDIISFQEVPNSFIFPQPLELLSNGRWTTTATAHSNKTSAADFTYIPDKIIAVNKWQQQKFKKEFGNRVPGGIWEYPIENKITTNEQRQKARRYLGLDNGIHILNMGLFTRGKNQGEIFEIAKSLPGCWFHFVGNQAINFKDYWEPLMKNKPDNCIVWGERNDVETFYQAADIFIFTSNYELFPIVLRESLSYGLPTFMKKLESYGDEYDSNPLVTYIDNNIQKTINIIDEYITRHRS